MTTQHNTKFSAIKHNLAIGICVAASVMTCNAYSAENGKTPEQIDADLLQLSIDQVQRSDPSTIGKLDKTDDRVQRQLAENHRLFANQSDIEFSKIDKSTVPMAPKNIVLNLKNNKDNYYILDIYGSDKAVYVSSDFGISYINLVALQHKVKATLIEIAADKRLATKEKSAPIAKTSGQLSAMKIDVVTNNILYAAPNYSIEAVPYSEYHTTQQFPGYTKMGFQMMETGTSQSIYATICGLPANHAWTGEIPNIGWYHQGYAYATCANDKLINATSYTGLSYTGTPYNFKVYVQ